MVNQLHYSKLHFKKHMLKDAKKSYGAVDKPH